MEAIIAAEAADCSLRRQRCLESSRESLQEAVAKVMPVTVVDALEFVDIDDCEIGIALAFRSHFFADTAEGGMVVEPGQTIVQRCLLELVLRLFRALEGVDQPDAVTICAQKRSDSVPDPFKDAQFFR